MGLSHSRKGRASSAQAKGLDGGRSRLEKRTGVDDDGQEPVAERSGQEIILVQPDDEWANDLGGRTEPQGRSLDAEILDSQSSNPAGVGPADLHVPTREKEKVIDATLVGYWDDVATMTGQALAGLVSKQLRRILK